MDFKKFEKIVLDKEVDDFDVLTMFLLEFDYGEWGEVKRAEVFLEEHRPRIAKTLKKSLVSIVGWALGPVEQLKKKPEE